MDLQERLAQCRKDKLAVEMEEQELMGQIEAEEKKIPFARYVLPENLSFGCPEPRLILHLTPEFVRLVLEHAGHVVSLGLHPSKGVAVMCNTTSEYLPTAKSLVGQYRCVETLIE